MTVSKEDALRIAREDAVQAYRDLSIYEVRVESHGDTWNIGYYPSDPFTVGGGPQYVISRETGVILFKSYEQ